jgi:hypothetical protein
MLSRRHRFEVRDQLILAGGSALTNPPAKGMEGVRQMQVARMHDIAWPKGIL